jgi:UPF0042 nucleotide-binding protein
LRIIIITGVSGAGKSLAVRTLEDLGYFCVDNLPPSLLPKFLEISRSAGKIEHIALVMDIRGGEFLEDLFPALDMIKNTGLECEILFLDASDNVLIKRFKESRRAHPLAAEGRLLQGIEAERRILDKIKKRADHVLDTTNLTPGQLKEEIKGIFLKGREFKGMVINIISFGFKFGIPLESDLVFDVRFIPNPFYVESMRKYSGKNPLVRDFVLKNPETAMFLEKLEGMLDFLIPNYIKEGKAQLVIGIGCTGGRHRSVVIADEVFRIFKGKQYTIFVDHRDMDK